MVFQRMHLGIGKRNCKCYTVVDEVYKYNGSSNFKSFNMVSRPFQECKQLSNLTLTFKARIYMD